MYTAKERAALARELRRGPLSFVNGLLLRVDAERLRDEKASEKRRV